MDALVFELGVLSPAEAERMPIRHVHYWADRAQPYLQALRELNNG